MTKQDIRDSILLPVKGRRYLATISAQEPGILSGIQWLERACRTIGINLVECKKNGEKVRRSDVIAVVEGSAKQIAVGEEELIGWISKASGIATAAWRAKTCAGKSLKVVSGAWKKMPVPVKHLVRQAIRDGGIHYRISENPFLYLDKNYVKIFGGVKNALISLEKWENSNIIVQLKSKDRRLVQEATIAAKLGASIIMIDTGQKKDIKRVDLILRKHKLRERVKIAFGGSIKIEDIRNLRRMPVDILDIGKAIVDAPLLDMRMDVAKKM